MLNWHSILSRHLVRQALNSMHAHEQMPMNQQQPRDIFVPLPAALHASRRIET